MVLANFVKRGLMTSQVQSVSFERNVERSVKLTVNSLEEWTLKVLRQITIELTGKKASASWRPARIRPRYRSPVQG